MLTNLTLLVSILLTPARFTGRSLSPCLSVSSLSVSISRFISVSVPLCPSVSVFLFVCRSLPLTLSVFLCAPFLCSLARSARSTLSLSLSLALSLLTLLEVSRVLPLCVSSFCTLFVFSLARALSLCLVRSLLPFLAVSRPHVFGSVARTSEMVSVRAHDSQAQVQANRREINLWLSRV